MDVMHYYTNDYFNSAAMAMVNYSNCSTSRL